MGPLRPHRPSDHVASYLARGENVVMEMKQHWARLLPAISSCLLGFVLVIVAGATAPAWMGALTNAAWWIWLVLLLHLLWRIIEWRDETFVITNKRLILVHGLFVKKVAMMPLAKVTDMSYNRSPAARLLGYGTFKIESAGQEQALNVIDFVRDPDEKYRDICGLIFGFDDEDDAGPRHREIDDDWHDPWPDDWDDHEEQDHGHHDDDVDGWDAHSSESPWDETRESDVTQRLVRRNGQWVQEDSRFDPFDAPPRRPSRRPARDVDETDPYGIITAGSRNPHSDPRHTYSDEYDARDGRAAWRDDEVEHFDDAPDESAWSVSREHATRPQAVRGSRHSVESTTWRDGQ